MEGKDEVAWTKSDEREEGIDGKGGAVTKTEKKRVEQEGERGISILVKMFVYS